MASSSIYSPTNDAPKSQGQPFSMAFTAPSFIRKDLPDNVQRQPFTPARNFTAQSLIFSGPNSTKAKPSGFGKLESMARQVTPL